MKRQLNENTEGMGSGINPKQSNIQQLGSGGPQAPLPQGMPTQVMVSNRQRWKREKELHTELRQYVRRNGMTAGVDVNIELPKDHWMDCNGGFGPTWYLKLQNMERPRLLVLKRQFIKSTPPTEQEWLNMYQHVYQALPQEPTVGGGLKRQAMWEARRRLQSMEEEMTGGQTMSVHDKQVQCGRKGMFAALRLGFLPKQALMIADEASRLPIERNIQLQKEEIEKELSCGMCFRPLRNPVMLCGVNGLTEVPCMHRFCRECIEQCLEREEPRCVLCKTNVKRTDVVNDMFVSNVQ